MADTDVDKALRPVRRDTSRSHRLLWESARGTFPLWELSQNCTEAFPLLTLFFLAFPPTADAPRTTPTTMVCPSPLMLLLRHTERGLCVLIPFELHL